MLRLFRSALYVPCDYERALQKAPERGADILIFDLEDGVAPERKAEGRINIQAFLTQASSCVSLLRINHRNTPEYHEDINLAVQLPLDGIMLSKVSGREDIDDAVAQLAGHDRSDLPVWCNVETPLGVANVCEIASHPHVAALVAGTNDLANDLRIRRTAGRAGLMYSLQRILLAGRAYKRITLDGTFVDLEDAEGFKAEVEQGRMLGFDGKTLIHPKQVEIANQVFGPSVEEIEEAKAVIAIYEKAMQEGKAVTLLGSRMIEKLHYDRARELVDTVSS